MKYLLLITFLLIGVNSFIYGQVTSAEIEELLHLAQNGDVDAQFDLACYYEENENFSKAFDWFQEAAIQNDADAQYKVGYYYWYRMKDKRNTENKQEAVHWWKLAAEKKQINACFYLGCCYYWGNDYYRKDDNDERIFGDMYKSIFEIYQINAMYSGEKYDFGNAIDLWMYAATEGHSVAQYFLAILHLRGILKETVSASQALTWLESAAEQGEPFPQYELGCYYLSKGEKGKAILYLTEVAKNDSGSFYNKALPAYYAQKQLIRIHENNVQERKSWLNRNKELKDKYEIFGFKF